MLWITGDTHGNFSRIKDFCERFQTTKNDLMIILGDNGVNYFGPSRDKELKKKLQKLPITLMLIRGNHDQRPSKKLCQSQWVYGGEHGHRWAGRFLVEPDFPSLLYTIDGSCYTLGNHTALVLGGAYSVDKWLRLENPSLFGRWFPDEQLTPSEREAILTELKHYARRDLLPNLVLSHTCPYSYIPREMFLGMVDQSTVDDSMERWMEEVLALFPKDNLQWYCGHWHTNKTIGCMHFLYEDIVSFVPLYSEKE